MVLVFCLDGLRPRGFLPLVGKKEGAAVASIKTGQRLTLLYFIPPVGNRLLADAERRHLGGSGPSGSGGFWTRAFLFLIVNAARQVDAKLGGGGGESLLFASLEGDRPPRAFGGSLRRWWLLRSSGAIKLRELHKFIDVLPRSSRNPQKESAACQRNHF